LESISPTFFEQNFLKISHVQLFFFALKFRLILFWSEKIGGKAALKMPLKLTSKFTISELRTGVTTFFPKRAVRNGTKLFNQSFGMVGTVITKIFVIAVKVD
jgi:hypothetical protein